MDEEDDDVVKIEDVVSGGVGGGGSAGGSGTCGGTGGGSGLGGGVSLGGGGSGGGGVSGGVSGFDVGGTTLPDTIITVPLCKARPYTRALFISTCVRHPFC